MVCTALRSLGSCACFAKFFPHSHFTESFARFYTSKPGKSLGKWRYTCALYTPSLYIPPAIPLPLFPTPTTAPQCPVRVPRMVSCLSALHSITPHPPIYTSIHPESVLWGQGDSCMDVMYFHGASCVFMLYVPNMWSPVVLSQSLFSGIPNQTACSVPKQQFCTKNFFSSSLDTLGVGCSQG